MKHTIWTSEINLSDWEDYIKEEYPDIYGDENEMYLFAVETNGDYLYDERANLNKELETEVIVLGQLGLWNGIRQGYKYLHSNNISDCLYSECDDVEWYVEGDEFKATGHHHDGTNYYTYRRLKPNLTWKQRDNMEDKFGSGNFTQKDIDRYTLPLGKDIAEIYGWED